MQSSFDSQDCIIGLPRAAHLHVLEAGLCKHACVAGWGVFLPLHLDQHVQREELCSDWPSMTLKQHGFHNQDTATYRTKETGT